MSGTADSDKVSLRGKYKSEEIEKEHRQGFTQERQKQEAFMAVGGKNPGDVWDIATASVSEEHFAAYPEKLVLRPILLTCPQYVCNQCGFIRERIIEKHRNGESVIENDDNIVLGKSIGWTQCKCEQVLAGTYEGGIGFDPFSGAGTTCLQLKKQSRKWFGCELNPKYVEDSVNRIMREAGTLF